MFPWAAPVARRYPPIVVWTVVGISVLALLYQVGLPPRVLDRFLFDFALVPSRFFGQLRLIAPSDWAPFLTNIFLHGGWLYVNPNMWTLWIVGPAVEDRLGPARFALFYLFCGVAAGLAHALANPDSVVPALGASGAIDPPPVELVHPEVCLLADRRTAMPKKRHKPEEIVAKLRQVDVLVSQGQSVADAIRSIGVTEVSYYRWRREFGGLKTDQVKRMKELEAENARLRRAVADPTLDKLILKEAASGNW